MASACSSTHSVATSTSGSFFTFIIAGLSDAMVLPLTEVIFNCGSKDVKRVATRSEKPLKPLITTTIAVVATATPMTDTILMILMA